MKKVCILFAFLAGFLFCISYKHSDLVEGFSSNDCPTLLIKKGKKIHLLNKNKALVPGVNPVEFDNLEQYAEYLQWQRRAGLRCPVLFLEEGTDTQNNQIYRISSDPFDPQGGNQPNDVMRGAGDSKTNNLIDANQDSNPPYNKNGFPAYDPENQNVGNYTPLDKMFHQTGKYSDNPMDSNWRGRGYKIKGVGHAL